MTVLSLSKKSVALSLLLAAFAFTSLQAQNVAYVANQGANTVSVINTSTNTVTATIPLAGSPIGVVFSPDGTRAYVTDNINLTGSAEVSVIATASNTVAATVPLGPNFVVYFPAITPDGKSLYVPNLIGNNVEVVDTATSTVSATITVGFIPSDVAITPDGTLAYVGNAADGSVSVINTAGNTVVGSPIPAAVAAEFLYLAVTPDGAHVYVTGTSNSSVPVIATATNTVSATVAGVPGSAGLAITPNGASVYVPDALANAVSLINTATNTVQPNLIPVGHQPVFAAVTTDGAFVYVTNQLDNTVSVISTAANTVVATIPVGAAPTGIAVADLTTPFAAFTVTSLTDNANKLNLSGSFTLGSGSSGLDLAHQPVTLTVGTFSITIPAGSFTQLGGVNHFRFQGTINGLNVTFVMQGAAGTGAINLTVQIKPVNLTLPNPVPVTLQIGGNSGTIEVTH